MTEPQSSAVIPTEYWHRLDDGRIQCDVCPRLCKLREGQRGFCFVRACQDGQIVLTTYGRSSGTAMAAARSSSAGSGTRFPIGT
jgi:pyruvate formate lyase activating enzyme